MIFKEGRGEEIGVREVGCDRYVCYLDMRVYWQRGETGYICVSTYYVYKVFQVNKNPLDFRSCRLLSLFLSFMVYFTSQQESVYVASSIKLRSAARATSISCH